MNSTLRTLLIQLIVLLGLLLLAEFALRLWFPLEDQQITERKVSQNLPGLKSDIVYQSRRFGLRSLQAIVKEKPINQIRILCLGASTTEQTTQETRDTWCGILEAELKKRFVKQADRIQTMAYGVGGHRAIDSAFWLREHIGQIQPDVVISLLGINDLAWNGGKDYQYEGLEAGFDKISENRPSGWVKSCQQYSQLCRRLVKVKQQLSTQQALNSGEMVEWHSNNLPKLRQQLQNLPESKRLTRNPDPFNEFQDAAHWLADYLKQQHIKLIMLGQPVLWQENMPQKAIDQLWFSISTANGPVRASGKWLQQEMARYNLAQRDIALKNDAHYRDLDALIPKSLDNYFDDCHFTDQGSKQVAASILPVLSKTVTEFWVPRPGAK